MESGFTQSDVAFWAYTGTGTYEGKPADVVVIPTANDETQLDVWVLAPGCTATNADVFTFARIARP